MSPTPIRSTDDKGVRAQRKAATRRALQHAARALFHEQGFAATQVADIARRAGVAHGTFYVHFADKRALLDDLLATYNHTLAEHLEAALRPTAATPRASMHPRAVVRRMAEACLEHWSEERALVLAFAERAGSDGNLASLRDGMSPPAAAFLIARLQELARLGGRELADAEFIVHAVLGMWMRVGLQFLFGTGGLTRARAVDLLADMTIGALGAAVPELAALAAKESTP